MEKSKVLYEWRNEMGLNLMGQEKNNLFCNVLLGFLTSIAHEADSVNSAL